MWGSGGGGAERVSSSPSSPGFTSLLLYRRAVLILAFLPTEGSSSSSSSSPSLQKATPPTGDLRPLPRTTKAPSPPTCPCQASAAPAAFTRLAKGAEAIKPGRRGRRQLAANPSASPGPDDFPPPPPFQLAVALGSARRGLLRPGSVWTIPPPWLWLQFPSNSLSCRKGWKSVANKNRGLFFCPPPRPTPPPQKNYFGSMRIC